MNKKLKFFLKTVYYILTFALGFMMAIVLPNEYKNQELMKRMIETVENQNFVSSMDLIGGFYDKEKAYQQKLTDDSGLIMFRAATLYDQSEVENAKQANIIKSVYAGFFYGISDYETQTQDNKTNSTKLVINDTLTLELLNYDQDGDEKNDSIVTLIENDYLYFEIPQETTSIINKLSFIDYKGTEYQVFSDLDLNFNDDFYQDLDAFILRYNDGLNDASKSEDLIKLSNSFLEKNSNYKMGGDYYSIATKKGMKTACIFVAIYFIGIYIFADCLLGKRFVIRFLIYLYRKIFKKEKVINENEVYGTDYYTQLTYILLVPEGCVENATVMYHNESEEIEMVFSKDKNYTVKQRVHAGVYQNAWLNFDGYEALNLPKILEIKGYTMEVKVTIRKIDTNKNE